VVLLSDRPGAIDPLVRALSRRGLSAVMAADAATVMVELAQRAVTAVVLVEPVPAIAGPLSGVVQRHHPATQVWRFRPPGEGKRAMLFRGVEPAEPAEVPGPPAPAPQTRGQTRGDEPAGDGGGEEGPLLTRDELAMLLEPLAHRDPGAASGD